MKVRGPLANSYAAAAAMVVLALVPYLVLTSAIGPLQKIIAASVHLSSQSLQLTSGMANAGYAFGTVLAVQLGLRTRPRRLLLLYAVLLVVGSVLTALAATPGLFIAGHILQGLCTSLLLIAAVPPLVTGWPAKRMPITVGIMNLCVFGAVALGPTVGNLQASSNTWHLLFWLVAGTSALALVMVLLTYTDDPAPEPKGPLDPISLLLAGGGSAAAFFGASELTTHAMLSTIVFVPLLAGTATLVLLVVHQATVKNPLMPVRVLFSTKPTAGILAAMCAGAAAVPAIDLSSQALQSSALPADAASLYWPFFGGAVALAVVFGIVLRTRFIAVLVFSGLVALAGGIVVMTGVSRGPHLLVAWGSGMIGYGVGATVAPGLFMAGFSVVAKMIQRVVALVELLRAIAAFLTAPILLHLAMTVNGGLLGDGVATSLWVCFAIACVGALLFVLLLVGGRARLQRPDLEGWQSDDVPAWESPALADGIRHGGGFRDDVLGAEHRAAAEANRSFGAPAHG